MVGTASKESGAGNLAAHAALGVLAFLTFAPFLFTIVTSFKTVPQYYHNFWLPAYPPHFENYTLAVTILGRFVLNSIIVSGISCLLVLLLSTVSGYLFARLDFPGRKILFASIVALLLVPGVLTLIPAFLVAKNLPYFWRNAADSHGILNTYWVLILPYASSGQVLGIFILRNFFGSLPQDLFDAARIDGAHEMSALWNVGVPLSMPVLGSVAIVTLLATWNNFIWPLVTVTDERYMVMTNGLSLFVSQVSTLGAQIQYGVLFAGFTVASLPLILVFLIFTRTFLRGMTAGALKA